MITCESYFPKGNIYFIIILKGLGMVTIYCHSSPTRWPHNLVTQRTLKPHNYFSICGHPLQLMGTIICFHAEIRCFTFNLLICTSLIENRRVLCCRANGFQFRGKRGILRFRLSCQLWSTNLSLSEIDYNFGIIFSGSSGKRTNFNGLVSHKRDQMPTIYVFSIQCCIKRLKYNLLDFNY